MFLYGGVVLSLPLKDCMELMDTQGHLRKLEHLSAVSTLEQLKKTSGSNPWPVIEACFTIWKDSSPTEWKSYLVHLDHIKDSRKVTTVGHKRFRGVSKDNEQGGINSYLLDIPQKVMLLIRCLYNSDELPMTKEFFYELAKRFPTFVIRERV